ncbi:MAG TPA: hypothetical protein VGW35_10505 [Methylomirabilota bacterium]|jgi:hypothetical protein|nr:hypothetical protein [Methylomirabilota bacterium]
MRWTIGTLLIVMALAVSSRGMAGAARVRVEGGLVSASFEAVPAPEALDAIRRATGVELVLPPAIRGKTLTFSAEQLPLEPFLRRVLDALDLGGFALVYEPNGDAGRLIVVGRGARGAASAVTSPAAADPDVEIPRYIPETEVPVYIPPATPPVYIPPASEPVYIPPDTEPQYIPPSE